MRRFFVFLGLALGVQALVLFIWSSTNVFESLVYYLYFVPWILLDVHTHQPRQIIMAGGSANVYLMIGLPVTVYSFVAAGLGFFIDKLFRITFQKTA